MWLSSLLRIKSFTLCYEQAHERRAEECIFTGETFHHEERETQLVSVKQGLIPNIYPLLRGSTKMQSTIHDSDDSNDPDADRF